VGSIQTSNATRSWTSGAAGVDQEGTEENHAQKPRADQDQRLAEPPLNESVGPGRTKQRRRDRSDESDAAKNIEPRAKERPPPTV
jgi:hypothetical protein